MKKVVVDRRTLEVALWMSFSRCNVRFPKSERRGEAVASAQAAQPAQFFRFDSFVQYWNTLCKDYDTLGEYPWRARSATPASVPVLSWVGDQDTFDPVTTRARWSTLSSKLSFQVMEGWSHDFGPMPSTGFLRVSDLVKA